MKITEYGAIRSASDIKRRKAGGASSATSFSDLLEAASAEDAAGSASLSDVAAPTPVSMLSAQEISDEELRRQKFLRRGHDLLESLEALRRQLLMGAVPLQTLRQLGHQLSAQRSQISDPHLIELMDEIELRAAVELAKLEAATKNL